MNKKNITIILSIICLVGLAASIFLYVSKDRQGPVISYNGDITYNEGDDQSTLLEGVSAVDEKDGDVSDTLMIESIYKNNGMAKVVYCAYDSSYNVTKLQRIVSYNSEPKQEEEVPVQINYEEELKNSKVTVLNGTSTSRVANYWKENLEAQGFKNVEAATSSTKVNNSIIYNDNENYREYLTSIFPLAISQTGKPSENQVDLSDSTVVIVIGEDYNTIRNSTTTETDNNEGN